VLQTTLEKITRGEGQPADLEILERTADTMVKTALCGLGQAASNPITSSLRYFRQEYEQHITHKTCPAAICPDLFQFEIIAERCSGCGLCLPVCRVGAITGERKQVHNLDAELCIQCRACLKACHRHAIVGVTRSEYVLSEVLA
jgi:ferredoxin